MSENTNEVKGQSRKVYASLEDAKSAGIPKDEETGKELKVRLFALCNNGTPAGFVYASHTGEAVQIGARAAGWSAEVAEGKGRVSAEARLLTMSDEELEALLAKRKAALNGSNTTSEEKPAAKKPGKGK